MQVGEVEIYGTVLVEDQLQEFLVLVPAQQDLIFLAAPFAPKDTSPKHQPSKEKENQKIKQNCGGKFGYSFVFRNQPTMNEENHEEQPSVTKLPLQTSG